MKQRPEPRYSLVDERQNVPILAAASIPAVSARKLVTLARTRTVRRLDVEYHEAVAAFGGRRGRASFPPYENCNQGARTLRRACDPCFTDVVVGTWEVGR